MKKTFFVLRPPVRIALIALSLLVAICVGGNAEGQLVRRTYTDTLEVHGLNLEVVVSDRDGQRLPGLGKEDFTLFVDDQPVAIEVFTEVQDGAYVQTVESYAEAGVISGKPSSTSFLVFIDEFGGKTYANTLTKGEKK